MIGGEPDPADSGLKADGGGGGVFRRLAFFSNTHERTQTNGKASLE
jgi:hypothetical protein